MISKEEWNKIESMLTGAFGRVELSIDGFNVVLQIERVKDLQYGIMPYINGEFRGSWLSAENDIGMRFYRPTSRFVFSAKQRASLIKAYGGKRCPKAELDKINKKITFLDPVWNSAKALRNHLIKNNKDLALVKVGY